MVKLVFAGPEFDNEWVELPEGKTTVGRGPANTLVIDHESVSSQHCHILVYGREIIVRDQNSTNGTWVNGCRVRGQTGVHNGQTVRFGSVEARVELPRPQTHEDETEWTAIYLHAESVKREAKMPRPEQAMIIRPRVPERSAA
jgi:pSer/pThr/pTyr-binding forkhead associated (FHA) protein